MPIENHSLINEFPEYRDRIHMLKTQNRHFSRLADAYDVVDHEVQLVEKSGQNTSDVYLEELRKKRLKLKDELFAMLKAAA